MTSWLVVLLFSVGSSESQTITGTIDGVVRDQSGQPIPDVQVVANSPSLIRKDLTVATDSRGYYRLPLLSPGTYTVVFQLSGFQPLERVGLIVTTGQTTAVDVGLGPAKVEESVKVVGESPTIDPRSATVGFTYTEAVLENLPTRRNFHSLMYTIPGVESTSLRGGALPGRANYENVYAAGQYANQYRFDGANVTNPMVGANQTQLFSYDIIEEVQVLKGAKPAEVGFAHGGFFQIITKSGGNEPHGVASAYYRDQSFQSDNLTDALRASLPPTLRETSDRVIRSTEGSVSLGGPIVKDALWWYGSARQADNILEFRGFPDQQEDRVQALFWKNTYQPHARHTLTGLVNHWDERVDPFFASAIPTTIADRRATVIKVPGGEAVNLRWTASKGDTILVESNFGYGRETFEQVDQPDSGIAVTDLFTGVKSGNLGIFETDLPGVNWQGASSLSWFVPGAGGRHAVKAGLDYTRATVVSTFTQNGDHALFVARGVPSQVELYNTPGTLGTEQRLISLFGQDSWTIGNRLTLNVGARFDRIELARSDRSIGGGQFADTSLGDTFPELKLRTAPAEPMVTWNSLAPRLAAAWSPNAVTVVKGSFSRYYHFLPQALLPIGDVQVSRIRLTWNDVNRDGAFQVGEEGRVVTRTAAVNIPVDPGLRHPYSDEVIVGLGRELLTDFSVTANFIHRRDKDLTGQVDVGVPFDAYTPVVVPDPGEDGVSGTPDDRSLTVFGRNPATFGQNQLMFTTPSQRGFENDQTYTAFEIVGAKRLSHNWHFVGSFIASRHTLLQPVNVGNPVTFTDPNNLVNARGRDAAHEPYQVKFEGTYLAPFDIVVGAFCRWSSGFPFTRRLTVALPQGATTVFAEPAGSRISDAGGLLDLRLEKTFRLPHTTRLGLMIDVFNLTNSADVLTYGNLTGVNLGNPVTVTRPRLARLGVRFTW